MSIKVEFKGQLINESDIITIPESGGCETNFSVKIPIPELSAQIIDDIVGHPLLCKCSRFQLFFSVRPAVHSPQGRGVREAATAFQPEILRDRLQLSRVIRRDSVNGPISLSDPSERPWFPFFPHVSHSIILMTEKKQIYIQYYYSS